MDWREKRARVDRSSSGGRRDDRAATGASPVARLPQQSESLLRRFGDSHGAPVTAVHPPLMNGERVHCSLERAFDVIQATFPDVDDTGDLSSILRSAVEAVDAKIYVNTVPQSDGTFDSHAFVDDVWIVSATGARSEQAAATLAYREVWRKMKAVKRVPAESPRQQPTTLRAAKSKPPDTVPGEPEPTRAPLLPAMRKKALRRYKIPDFGAQVDPSQVMLFHRLSAEVVRYGMVCDGREVFELLEHVVNALGMSLALAKTTGLHQREPVDYCHVFVDNVWLASAEASNAAEARERACRAAWAKLRAKPLFVGPSLEFLGNDELYVASREPQHKVFWGGPPADYQAAAAKIYLPYGLLSVVVFCALSQMLRGMRIRDGQMALMELKRAAGKLNLALSFSAAAGGRGTVNLFIEGMWLTEGTGMTVEAAEVSTALSAVEMLRSGTAVPGPSVAGQQLLVYVPDDERIDGRILAKGMPRNNVIVLVPDTFPREFVEQHQSAYPAHLGMCNSELTRGTLQALCLFAKLFAFRDLMRQAEGKDDLAAFVTQSAARAKLDVSCSPEQLPQDQIAYMVFFDGLLFGRGIGTDNVAARLAAFSEIKHKIAGDVFAVSPTPCGTRFMLHCLRSGFDATSRGCPRLQFQDGEPVFSGIQAGIQEGFVGKNVAAEEFGVREPLDSGREGDRVSLPGSIFKPKQALLLKFLDIANAIPGQGSLLGMEWLEDIALQKGCTLSYNIQLCSTREKPKLCDLFVNDIWISCGEGTNDTQAKNDAADAALRRLKSGPLRIDVSIVIKGKLQLFCCGDDDDMEALKHIRSEQIRADLGSFVLIEDHSGCPQGPVGILARSAAANNNVPYRFRPFDNGQYCTVELAGHVLGSSIGQTKMSKHEAAAEALEVLRSCVPTVVIKKQIDMWGDEVTLPSEKGATTSGEEPCGAQIPSDNVGHRLLTRMGWTGGGMGRGGRGIVQPMMPTEASGRQGLGYVAQKGSPQNPDKLLRRIADKACLEYATNQVLQDLVFSPALSKRLGTSLFETAKRYGLRCTRVKRPHGKSYVVSHRMLPQQLLSKIRSEGPTSKYEFVEPAQQSSLQE